jgi:hypothetical protein
MHIGAPRRCIRLLVKWTGRHRGYATCQSSSKIRRLAIAGHQRFPSQSGGRSPLDRSRTGAGFREASPPNQMNRF